MKSGIGLFFTALACFLAGTETFAQNLSVKDKVSISIGVGPALNLQTIEQYGKYANALGEYFDRLDHHGGPLGWGLALKSDLNVLLYKILYAYVGFGYNYSSVKYNLRIGGPKDAVIGSHSVNVQLGIKAQKFVLSKLGLFVSAGAGANAFNVLHKKGLTIGDVNANDNYVVQSRPEIKSFRFLMADFGIGTVYKVNAIIALLAEAGYSHPIIKYTITTLSYENDLSGIELIPVRMNYEERGMFALQLGASISLLSNK